MTMRSFLTLLAIIALSGCGITGGSLVSGDKPTGQIIVANQSGGVIDVILLSRCSSSTYGLNRLGRDEYVPSGYERVFTVDAGCWDVGVGRVGFGQAYEKFEVRPGGTQRYTITG